MKANFKSGLSQWNAMVLGMSILLVLSVVLGGATRENALRLALLELTALPIAALMAIKTLERQPWREHRFAFALILATTALPLVHLVPLPPGIWTNIAGREDSELAFSLAGLTTPWAPISLSPELTWKAFLALIPPSAAFLGATLMSGADRSRLMGFVIGLTAVSLILGAAQMAGGRWLYPYTTTAFGDVVGFFANRNHLATLCLMTVPFAAVLLGAAARRRRPSDRLVIWASGVFLVLALFALIAIRSRAGIVLAVPAFVLSGVGASLAAGRGLSWKRLLAGAIALAILGGAAYLGGERVLQRFEGATASTQSRLETWPVVAETAGKYQPLGSGLGSFDAIYRAHEPLEFVDPTFLNHAHNDYLEIWLETGWLGALLMGAFLIWFARRTARAWSAERQDDADLQRAASVAILVLLLHSFVDYPLRTEAIVVMFAICCAILESPVAPRSRRRGLQAA